ncbi:unknown [Odoribacter sp. CAG:788]|nr:unknown [Odoribacter sp. CAG:788]
MLIGVLFAVIISKSRSPGCLEVDLLRGLEKPPLDCASTNHPQVLIRESTVNSIMSLYLSSFFISEIDIILSNILLAAKAISFVRNSLTINRPLSFSGNILMRDSGLQFNILS